jgi:hypothetical protein
MTGAGKARWRRRAVRRVRAGMSTREALKARAALPENTVGHPSSTGELGPAAGRLREARSGE